MSANRFPFETIRTDDPAMKQALRMMGQMRDFIMEQLRQLGADV